MAYAEVMDSLVRSLPPLRALLAFEAAARLGSFTAAAAELGVSQPAVSRQVKMLEDRLGLALFLRAHRRVVPTDAGAAYYQAVRAAFEGIASSGQLIAQMSAPDRVTVYANYGLASYWLMPRLAALERSYPEVEIVARTVESDRRLSDSEPEIAIRFGDGNWDDGDARLLFSEVVFPVCSPAYLQGRPPIASAGDLRRHRLLRIEAEDKPWLDWPGFFRALRLSCPRQVGRGYNNYTLAIQAALAGQGIALGWAQIVDDFLQRGWLVRPIGEEVATDLGYYSVTNPRRRPSQSLDILLSWLHAEGAAASTSL